MVVERERIIENIKDMGFKLNVTKYMLQTELARQQGATKGRIVYYLVKTVDQKEYILKTFNNQIIRDKKDKGYRNAMKVRGLESWYVDTVRSIEFIEGEAKIEYVPFNELLHKTVYVKNCEMVLYAYYKDGELETVLVNTEEYTELNYKEVNKCIDVATGGYHKNLVAIEYRKVR